MIALFLVAVALVISCSPSTKLATSDDWILLAMRKTTLLPSPNYMKPVRG